jgi:hypothetical protein
MAPLKKSPASWLTVVALVVAKLGRLVAAEVSVNWLDHSPPALATGVSFGVPWPKGAVKAGQKFSLTAADGTVLPVQTWPLAYWPDGSLKWSGLATVAGPATAGPFKLATAETVVAETSVRVRKSNTTVEVDTGKLRCRVALWGANLIESMWVDGREVARQGKLVCIVQDGPDGAPEASPREMRSPRPSPMVTPCC